MKAKTKPGINPKRQLDSFLAKYDPAIAAFTRRVLAKLRKRLPGAVEIVYDNYNALVIGFGPNDKPSVAIFSVVLFPRWVILYFLQGLYRTPKGVLRARVRPGATSAWKVYPRWTTLTSRT